MHNIHCKINRWFALCLCQTSSWQRVSLITFTCHIVMMQGHGRKIAFPSHWIIWLCSDIWRAKLDEIQSAPTCLVEQFLILFIFMHFGVRIISFNLSSGTTEFRLIWRNSHSALSTPKGIKGFFSRIDYSAMLAVHCLNKPCALKRLVLETPCARVLGKDDAAASPHTTHCE